MTLSDYLAALIVTHRADVRIAQPMGTRYARIVKGGAGSGASAVAFVDRTTGEVLQAASWREPGAPVGVTLTDLGAVAA